MKIKVFSLIGIFIVFSICLQAQAIYVFEVGAYHGEVVTVYKSNLTVSGRTDSWSFKDKRFSNGAIYHFNDDKTFHSIESFFHPDQSAFIYYNFKNDQKGHLISGTVSVSHSPDFTTNLDYIRKDGQLVEMKEVKASTGDILAGYVYGYEGSLLKSIEVTFYQKDKKQMFHYDDKKRVQKLETYNLNNQLVSVANYEYNEQGHPSLITFFDPSGKEANRQSFEYQYDEKGNWTSSLRLDQKTGQYQLSNQIILYKEDVISGKVSKAQLEGKWIGWDSNTFMAFNGKNYRVIRDGKSYDGKDLEYDPYTRYLQMQTGYHKRRGVYEVSFDGKILKLDNIKLSEVFYLIKVATFNNGQKEGEDQINNVEVFKNDSNGLYGLKSAKGKIIIPAEYRMLRAYASTRTVLAQKGALLGLLDFDGNEIVPLQYERLKRDKNGYYKFSKERSGKTGVLSPTGEVVVPAIYDNLFFKPKNKILVRNGELKGIITLEGKEVQPIVYTSIVPIGHNRIIGWKKNNEAANALFDEDYEWKDPERKTDLFDEDYQLIKSFEGWREIEQLNVNRFKISGHGGWELIDSMGNAITTLKHNKIESGEGNTLRIQKEDKWGLTDLTGNIIADPVYDQIIMREDKNKDWGIIGALQANNAMAMYMRDGTFGYLDAYGKEYLPKASPSYNSERLTDVYEQSGQFSFHYRRTWDKKGDGLSIDEGKAINAGLDITETNYEGDLRAWLKLKHPDKEVQEIPVGEATVLGIGYIVEQRANHTSNDRWILKFYVPLNDAEAVVLNFDSSYYGFYKYAQDIYNMVYALKVVR